MNKNTIITTGLIVLILVLIGTGLYIKKGSTDKDVVITPEVTETQKVSGEINAIFEGDNITKYSFSIPSDAVSTKKNQSGTIVHVTNASSSLITALYFSFEGGRGYTAQDYVQEVIATKVPVVTITGSSTIGNLSGIEASSDTTVWRIAPTDDGQFLLVAEYPKSQELAADGILATFKSE